MKSKQKLFILIPLAIITGFIITLLLTGQENFKTLGNYCYNPAADEKSDISSVACGTVEMGYPWKFLSTWPAVQINTNPGSQNEKVLAAVASPKIETWKLFGDIAIWSSVSLAVLILVETSITPRNKKRKRQNT